MIVDADADLDVAVLEGVASAFRFQGQKCSASSRIIVLESRLRRVRRTRFVEAARSVRRSGRPDDPASRMGPVIDSRREGGHRRLHRAGQARGPAGARSPMPPAGGWPMRGYFVGPHIFADVAPDAVIAQEEIFGPVVAVMKARDMDEALAIANGTQYALTGGLISPQPGDHRARPPRVPRRQPLHQPQHHRGARRAPALRRLQDERHRLQGRRAGLPGAVHGRPPPRPGGRSSGRRRGGIGRCRERGCSLRFGRDLRSARAPGGARPSSAEDVIAGPRLRPTRCKACRRRSGPGPIAHGRGARAPART